MKDKEVLVKYEEDFGRMGDLDALVIMSEQQFKDMGVDLLSRWDEQSEEDN